MVTIAGDRSRDRGGIGQTIARALTRARTLGGRIPADARYVSHRARRLSGEFRAVVVGGGLGGLATAAHLARHGFPVVLLERHSRPGGYATRFQRGDFFFEVSLHAISALNSSVGHILSDLGIHDRVRFHPLPELHRYVSPGRDIVFPAADMEGYEDILADRFPAEKHGIRGFVDTMERITAEVYSLHDRAETFLPFMFPIVFPEMWRHRNESLAGMISGHTRDPSLAALLSVLWPYYGLPPSRLSAFYYAAATGEYIKVGGDYPEGHSQAISDALVGIIEESGGEVHLARPAERIEVRDGRAVGVRDAGGTFWEADAVVSNASAPATFHGLVDPWHVPRGYRDRLAGYAPSISSFCVWLGLDRDVSGEIREAEIFLHAREDPEADYEACVECDADGVPLIVSVYDHMAPGLVPEGKSAVGIAFPCGYEPWRPFERDYRAGDKDGYLAAKDAVARAAIGRVERALLPGLSSMIEEMETGSPLTNLRYTSNPGGAIYGYEMSLDNAFMKRNDNRTPIRGLYLAGAWGSPGGGYAACFRSAQQTWRLIVDDWERLARRRSNGW